MPSAVVIIPIAGAWITVPSCERSVTAIGALVLPAQAAVIAPASPKPVSNPVDVDDAIIDGEMIAVDETCRPQFYDLLRGTRAPAYVAFDIAWLNGADQRSLPLSDRRRNLQGIMPEGASVISEALSVAGKGRELFDLMWLRWPSDRP